MECERAVACLTCIGDPKQVQEVPSEVIERCRRGDVAALGEIYHRLGARVWRVARNMLGSDAEADDLTQDVFVRVFEKFAQFEGRSNVATWIHRTTVNLCLNQLQARTRARERTGIAPPSLDELSARTAGPGAEIESTDELEAWLGPLSPDARAILVLREVEGLEYGEIAEALDVPVGTVMSRLSRAREKLAEHAARRLAATRPAAGGSGT